MVRDMTKGSPVRLLLTFAAPLLVANIFQQLYTVVDAVVLGRGVGVRALAAAGSTGSVHFLVFGFITGLTHGYSILISQKFGAGSAAGVRRAVANSAYIAVLSSAVITVLSLVFSRGLMELMQTPADIFEDALLYIRIIFIGIVAGSSDAAPSACRASLYSDRTLIARGPRRSRGSRLPSRRSPPRSSCRPAP